MTSLERQYELKKKGITQHQIAVDLDVSDIAVSDVILGHMVSDRIMRAIAAALGEDVSLIFGDYYLRAPKRKTSKVSQAA